MNDAQWPMPWIRAALEPAILASLGEAPLHGYAIAARLADAGMGRLKGGSLYPILGKLEADGFIVATWQPGESGPGRKAYELTESGRRHSAELQQQWAALSAALAALGKES